MKIKKLRRSRTALIVMQGLLLLVVLAAMLSACFQLVFVPGSETPETVQTAETVQDSPAARTDEGRNTETPAAGTDSPEAQPPEGEVPETGSAVLPEEEMPDIVVESMMEIDALVQLLAGMYAALSLMFLTMALSRRSAWNPNLIRYGLGTLAFGFCAILFLTNNPEIVYAPAAMIHAVYLITDHVFSIVRNHKVRNLVPRILFILAMSVVPLGAAAVSGSMLLTYVLFLTIPRVFYYIARIAFSRVKMDILRKILRKTYAAEILFGMLLLIVAFSIVLPNVEPNIPNFGDALWYCFAIVTTIGFGDFAAVSIPGRIVSVILGLYGIVVVALITSIIVNFYSETKNSGEDEEAEDAEETEDQEAPL